MHTQKNVHEEIISLFNCGNASETSTESCIKPVLNKAAELSRRLSHYDDSTSWNDAMHARGGVYCCCTYTHLSLGLAMAVYYLVTRIVASFCPSWGKYSFVYQYERRRPLSSLSPIIVDHTDYEAVRVPSHQRQGLRRGWMSQCIIFLFVLLVICFSPSVFVVLHTGWPGTFVEKFVNDTNALRASLSDFTFESC